MSSPTHLLILLSLLARSAVGQQLRPDSTIARLAWGSVNVLVEADTVNGMLLWAETSGLAETPKPLTFTASFDPQLVDPWLNYANALVTTTKTPRDSDVALQTPELVARDSSRIVLLRRRKKDQWDPHSALLLLDRDRKVSWYIDMPRDDARNLIKVLFTQSGRSRQRPDTSGVHDANPLQPRYCPQPLGSGPVPTYPVLMSRNGISGEVWLEYVVRKDGTVDPNSFRVLLSDATDFAQAAITAVRHTRYDPAWVGRAPVAARVHQRFVFRSRSR